MPTGSAIVAKLKNIEPIEGADRIAQAKIYGETVIISKDHKEGDLGILFDIETQLSHEFCHHNNLYRHSELNADKTQSGYIEDNRRVRPIRLRGVQCSGMWIPIMSLAYATGTFKGDVEELKEGTQLTEFAGTKICEKYKVPSKTQGSGNKNKEDKTSKKHLVPTFKEHFSTDHWARNMHRIQDGDTVILTEKLHGTSFRCGNLRVKEPYNWWDNIVWFMINLLLYFRIRIPKNKSHHTYKFVVGSRKAVKSIDGEESKGNHYYNEDLWTSICEKNFKGKLEKGETVYGEIVGYTPQGAPIMGTHSNEKLKKFMDKKDYKEFIERYGNTTRFHYGTFEMTHNGDTTTTNKSNKAFVYRITRTNEDGESIDLSWEQVKQRCERLGVEHVPELGITRYNTDFDENHIEYIDKKVQELTNSPSKNFPGHIKEGVVIRIENGSLTPIALKHKAYLFRVLEGQITEPTMEDEN